MTASEAFADFWEAWGEFLKALSYAIAGSAEMSVKRAENLREGSGR